jgi:Fe-S cluster assembly protein SufD
MTTHAHGQPAWLTAIRESGAARFAETGLPTQRQEAWKYTGLNRLKALTFEPTAVVEVAFPLEGEVDDASASTGVGIRAAARQDSGSTFTSSRPSASAAPHPATKALPTSPSRGEAPSLIEDAAHRLIFANGRLASAQLGDLPEGVILGGLADLLRDRPELLEPHIGRLASIARRPMAALNAAWIEDGLVLIVPRSAAIHGVIEATFIASDNAPVSHPRHLIVLGENAEAVLVERHVGGATGGFTNAVTEITLGSGARLGHYIAHVEPMASTAIDTVCTEIGRDASYRAFGLTAGAGLVRRETEAALTQAGARAQIDGAYLVDAGRHSDTTILIDHQAPHCASRQTQKGVIDGDGRAVFQGKILVRPDAQKTDGYQLSQTLLLSPEAEIDVKPELEIHADDVKCSHGATVGRLDADALFFLRSRGIPPKEARALLIEGFIGGALDEIGHPAVRDAFGMLASNWLAGRAGPEISA